MELPQRGQLARVLRYPRWSVHRAAGKPQAGLVRRGNGVRGCAAGGSGAAGDLPERPQSANIATGRCVDDSRVIDGLSTAHSRLDMVGWGGDVENSQPDPGHFSQRV